MSGCSNWETSNTGTGPRPESMDQIAEVICRNYAGFNSAAHGLILIGSNVVWVTETVKVLAEFLFQSRDAIVRFGYTSEVQWRPPPAAS